MAHLVIAYTAVSERGPILLLCDKATTRWSIFAVRSTHFTVNYLLLLVKCNAKVEMKLPKKSNNQHSQIKKIWFIISIVY